MKAYKIIDAINVVIRNEISNIWTNRSLKIKAKYPYYRGTRPSELADRLWQWGNRISEVGADMFNPEVKSIRPEKPKRVEKIEPPKPDTLPIGLIDSNSFLWKRTHSEHWYTNGKITKKIIDYTGYKVIRPGEKLPETKVFKEVKPKGEKPEYRKPRYDNPYDDTRYEY